MNANELRRIFLGFYEKRGHKVRPGDCLVPENDPTVLFTPAGVNQFKDQLLGKRIKFRRATTCQKCLRTDDIEKVGRTPGHHTFFEMLGNFSFGDYFKEEAIVWGWEFVVEELGMSPERLNVSVYEGDEESLKIWVEKAGLPEERVWKFDAGENFWPANAPAEGPNGPCGPCSEIFYDMGEEAGEDRHVEIYNLVFTEFNRLEGGVLEPLPSKNIDTGMGLERVVAVLEGGKTNFDTSLFRPIIDEICRVTGAKYDPGKESARSIRRIADHARAVVFCIADGVLPSNQGRGYVERRLLRQAVMDGRGLGVEGESFLYRLVPAITEVMAEPYPEVKERRENIAGIVKAEEERFLVTLDRGIREMEGIRDTILRRRKPTGYRTQPFVVMLEFPAEDAFRLYDSSGLPLDIIAKQCTDWKMTLDMDEFNRMLSQQREQARQGTKISAGIFDNGPLAELKNEVGSVEFVGYEKLRADGKLLSIIKEGEAAESASAGDGEVELIFDRTPFYGEAGGQAGDTGEIRGKGAEAQVLDCAKADDFIIHRAKILKGEMRVGEEYELAVDEGRRRAIKRAHTATHLLHRALREVLGEHAEQAGSLVAPDRVRFDFPHPQRVSQRELREIERLVNGWILENRPVAVDETTYEEARRQDAIALFGEKYGERVRMVQVEGVSKELCGGTHAKATGDIGSFKVVSEGSIGTGLRRVEAVVGEEAFRRLNELEDEVGVVCDLLRCQEGRLRTRVEELVEEVHELETALKLITQEQV